MACSIEKSVKRSLFTSCAINIKRNHIMGNRALIIMEKPEHGQEVPAIYVHWNGGVESVAAVCEVCRQRKFRSPDYDPSYAMARMVGVWHEFFGLDDPNGLGVVTYDGRGDYGDNGVYLIGENWTIEEHYIHQEGKRPLRTDIDPNSERQKSMLEGIPAYISDRLDLFNEATGDTWKRMTDKMPEKGSTVILTAVVAGRRRFTVVYEWSDYNEAVTRGKSDVMWRKIRKPEE